MDDFRNVIDHCWLRDLGFEGDKFTWTNRNFEGKLIWERLDRCLANLDFIASSPSLESLTWITTILIIGPLLRGRKRTIVKRIEPMDVGQKDLKTDGLRSREAEKSKRYYPNIKCFKQKLEQCISQLKRWDKDRLGGSLNGVITKMEKEIKLFYQDGG